MLDVLTETLIDLPTAAREPALRNPRTGKACHLTQLYRYIQNGARSANGERVKLEAVRCPGGLRTSREAIARWIALLTDPDRRPATAASRGRQPSRAEADLIAAGFEVGGPEA